MVFKQYLIENVLKWNDVFLKVNIYYQFYFVFLMKFHIGVVITTSGFIFTWTPYAVTLFVSAFQGKDYAISPLATFFCACFAKSSVIWIPMLYIGTSTQFQLHIVNQNAFDQIIGANRVDATLITVPIAPRIKDEMEMVPATGNVGDKQPPAINHH